MSYGVIAWKSGQVQVEEVEPLSSAGYDRARERYRAKAPAPWRSGRVTLTPLTLTYVPSGGAVGARPVTIDLRELRGVEASPGRLGRVVSFRTDTRVLHLRAGGGYAFAKRVAIARESLSATSDRSARR